MTGTFQESALLLLQGTWLFQFGEDVVGVVAVGPAGAAMAVRRGDYGGFQALLQELIVVRPIYHTIIISIRYHI